MVRPRTMILLLQLFPNDDIKVFRCGPSRNVNYSLSGMDPQPEPFVPAALHIVIEHADEGRCETRQQTKCKRVDWIYCFFYDIIERDSVVFEEFLKVALVFIATYDIQARMRHQSGLSPSIAA